MLVYSTDGQRTLQGSVLTPELEAAARPAGIGGAGTSGRARSPSPPPTSRRCVDHRLRNAGSAPLRSSPRVGSPSPGEAVASEADVGNGFDVGDTIVVEPGGLELTVVGLAPDAQLNVRPDDVPTYDTYLAAVAPATLAAAPRSRTRSRSCRPRAPPGRTRRPINAGSDDLDALTRQEAADGRRVSPRCASRSR